MSGILIRVVGKRLVGDGLVNVFFDLFASYSLNELESFYSQLDEESSVSKNIYGISALKKGFKNIFPVDKYSDFQRIEINPARCFVEIEASEFYDEEWMTDISRKISNFNNSIVLDLETYMEAASNLEPTELLELINDKIKQNKIKGMTIFYLD